MKTCQAEGCTSTPFAKGFCIRHFGMKKKLRADNKSGKTYYQDPAKAFEARSEWQGECRIWHGSVSAGSQIGGMSVNGKHRSVRQVAWYVEHNEWSKHRLKTTCDNKLCVNIDHLEQLSPVSAS